VPQPAGRLVDADVEAGGELGSVLPEAPHDLGGSDAAVPTRGAPLLADLGQPRAERHPRVHVEDEREVVREARQRIGALRRSLVERVADTELVLRRVPRERRGEDDRHEAEERASLARRGLGEFRRELLRECGLVESAVERGTLLSAPRKVDRQRALGERASPVFDVAGAVVGRAVLVARGNRRQRRQGDGCIGARAIQRAQPLREVDVSDAVKNAVMEVDGEHVRLKPHAEEPRAMQRPGGEVERHRGVPADEVPRRVGRRRLAARVILERELPRRRLAHLDEQGVVGLDESPEAQRVVRTRIGGERAREPLRVKGSFDAKDAADVVRDALRAANPLLPKATFEPGCTDATKAQHA
jgi:hypothetical protein